VERKIYLSNTSLSKAKEIFLNAALKKEPGVEEIPVFDAAGRVTAEPVFARISSPHYHAAAMDGVAVKSSDTFGATATTPLRLRLEENAFYIDTGGLMPPGCDAVIMIEDVFFPEKDKPRVIEIREPAAPWQHVRSIGEDIVATEMILPSYHWLRPFDLGALLNGGIFKLNVLKEPLVSLIPTGSELIEPPADPLPGQIIESNSYVFSAAVRGWGARVKRFPIIKDDPAQLENALREASKESDLILISAGSSAGRKDYTVKILDKLGEVLIHGVAIRPGKPVILAVIGSTPVVGLPGYPVAAYVALELFVKPFLYYWQKQTPPDKPFLEAYSSRRVLSSLKEEEFLRLKVGKVEDKFVATPLSRGSGVSMSLVRADGVTTIPQNKEGIEPGEGIQVELWRSRDEIENTIVCLGSHDLSLDILSDHLKKSHGYTLSSAHVGSMGGIMALKRGETHLAGIHLLDEESGVYNISYLERYLPEMELVLVHLAQRELGLMLEEKNKARISSLEDLAGDNIVFVNRQKGAGTRLYLDYMLKKKGINPADITGYGREEYDHLSVAAAVKAGGADTGLGIRAAAEALGLEFIPLTRESYELAVPASFYNTPKCRALLEVIGSDAFRNAVEKMGGYDLTRSGEIVWRSHPDKS
jgi:putative molybdopterin biosynthesis protein